MIIYDAWPQARRATQSHTMTISQPHHCRFSSDRSRIVCLSSTMSSRTKVATTGHVYQRRIPPALEGGFLSCFLSGTTPACSTCHALLLDEVGTHRSGQVKGQCAKAMMHMPQSRRTRFRVCGERVRQLKRELRDVSLKPIIL